MLIVDKPISCFRQGGESWEIFTMKPKEVFENVINTIYVLMPYLLLSILIYIGAVYWVNTSKRNALNWPEAISINWMTNTMTVAEVKPVIGIDDSFQVIMDSGSEQRQVITASRIHANDRVQVGWAIVKFGPHVGGQRQHFVRKVD